MLGSSVFSFELFGHDYRSHYKRQRKVCKCCYELATLQLDYGKYRDNHGYPKYYARLTSNKDNIESFNVEELYKISFGSKCQEIIRDVYA